MASVWHILPLLGVNGIFNNAGTPVNVPPFFDCKVRQAVWEYGKTLLPGRGEFKTLFDAMQLANGCNIPEPTTEDVWIPPYYKTPSDSVCIFVDAYNGHDANGDGSKTNPFQTLDKAIQAVSGGSNKTILLRKGFYYTPGVELTKKHTDLTIQNFEGERATISGGVPLTLPAAKWQPFKISPGTNIWKIDISKADPDADALLRTEPSFKGLRVGPKLRRAVRAKYPNGDPELSGESFVSTDPGMGQGEYTRGWIPLSIPVNWVKPMRQPDAVELVSNAADWPGVYWPTSEEGGLPWTGEGDWGDFHIGMGGYCSDLFPPTGYWCSMEPPRGQCFDNETMTSQGCTQTHMAPSGLNYSGVLDRANNYSNPVGAVVQSWRGGGRWFTQQCRVSSINKTGKVLLFGRTTDGAGGCNQGGEGEVSASEWWIENVLEELDEANEFFFDVETRVLYYAFNSTSKPSGFEQWTATRTEVLFNITGTQSEPVCNVTIRGLELRDTSYTYLGTGKAAVHGMPSGGDWALQRSGAVLIDGTEGTVIDACAFARVDGNGISLNNYNRRAMLTNNDFSWIGDSAMASWGATGFCMNEKCSRLIPYPNGPDGRGGNQPRGTTVSGNIAREIGIWQKQSSMWFQATSAGTHFVGNVFFNGPRAALNFNDGFGGGDVVERNLLANCVRESGDHGPFNSWDRVPYITELGMLPDPNSAFGYKPAAGLPSIIPTFREIRNNFILSTYSSQEALDNDDGSSYYHSHDNFFVYATVGLKSDFGGQWNWHWNNVYAYVGECFNLGNNLAFFNNTCVTFNNGYASDCPRRQLMPLIYGNSVSNEAAEMTVCGSLVSLSEWLHDGHDVDTTLSLWPSDEDLIAKGMAVLGTTSPHASPTPSGASWASQHEGIVVGLVFLFAFVVLNSVIAWKRHVRPLDQHAFSNTSMSDYTANISSTGVDDTLLDLNTE